MAERLGTQLQPTGLAQSLNAGLLGAASGGGGDEPGNNELLDLIFTDSIFSSFYALGYEDTGWLFA